jgi:glucose/arabinose dehydrogenase
LDSQGNYLGEEDFITGWFKENEAVGRPVDILIKDGGIIYISDDKAGVIYRVIYKSSEK